MRDTHAGPGRALFGKVAPLALLALLFALTFPFASVPSAHAASVVASGDSGCGGLSAPSCGSPSVDVSIGAPGQSLVVAVSTHAGPAPTLSDTAGTRFTLFSSNNYAPEGLYVEVYYGTAKASGSDTVSVSYSSNPLTAGLYVYVVSGITNSSAKFVTGTGGVTQKQSTWTDITNTTLTYPSGAFVLGIDQDESNVAFTPTTSFTSLTTGSSGDPFSMAESLSPSSSSTTNFPVGASTANTGGLAPTYLEVGVAFPSLPATLGTYLSSSACTTGGSQTSSFTAGTDTVYGGLISTTTTSGTPWSLNYVEPDGTIAHTVSNFPSSSQSCDSTGYTLPSNAPTGTWALELKNSTSYIIGSKSFTVSAPVPEFPLGALFLLLPMVALYFALRRTRTPPGEPLG